MNMRLKRAYLKRPSDAGGAYRSSCARPSRRARSGRRHRSFATPATRRLTGDAKNAGRFRTNHHNDEEENSMQPRTSMLQAAALGAGMFLGSAALAADLPNEGTFSWTYSSAGTFKGTPVGKERLLVAWDENGLSVGNGLFDHMTWHCWGVGDTAKGMTHWQGYCVATDPAGDHLAVDVASDGKYPADAKNFKATGKLTTGTGKYAGISGGFAFVGHGPDFRTAAEGTYAQYGTAEGSYKLP
jgi:hypothetical protein